MCLNKDLQILQTLNYQKGNEKERFDKTFIKGASSSLVNVKKFTAEIAVPLRGSQF